MLVTFVELFRIKYPFGSERYPMDILLDPWPLEIESRSSWLVVETGRATRKNANTADRELHAGVEKDFVFDFIVDYFAADQSFMMKAMA